MLCCIRLCNQLYFAVYFAVAGERACLLTLAYNMYNNLRTIKCHIWTYLNKNSQPNLNFAVLAVHLIDVEIFGHLANIR